MASKSTEKQSFPQESAPSEGRSNSLDQDHELPTYEDSTPGPSLLQQQSTASSANTPIGPTITSPFNFPSTSELPPPDYTSNSSRPIAIPQQFPQATAPFLLAFPPVLLNYGIPPESWYSFVDTTSAFLTAKVGKRAVSHAGDIAASVGRVPKKLGKDVANHVKGTFSRIGDAAKHGNPIGVVGGLIGGTIGLTVGTAAKLVGSTMSLPATAIGAAANPKTPKDRAQAYALAANKDWFHKRALHAELLNTAELAVLLGVSVQQILDAAHAQSTSAEGQMNALRDLIEGVELRKPKGKEATTRVAAASPSESPALSPAGFPADIKTQPDAASSQSELAPTNASSSKASAVKANDVLSQLHISVETLWLVLRREGQPEVPKRPGI